MSFLTKKGLRYFWAHIAQRLEQKVTVEQGKGLSTNDYTDEEKLRLATIAADHLTSVDKAELSGAIAEAVKQAAQADWNVNDADDPAYIKNRTHYTDSFELVYNGNYRDYTFIDVGLSDMYVVKIQDEPLHIGDVIDSTMIIGEDSYIITPELIQESDDGNFSVLDESMISVTTSYRMARGTLDRGTYVCHFLNVDPFYFKIAKEVTQQLDEKFIPATIARVENIPVQEQADWAENNINSVSYIKNRTHYETTEVVTVLDETIDLIADQIVKVSAIPDDFIIDYNKPGIEAYFDEEHCIIVDMGDSWKLYDSNDVEVLTIWNSEGGSNCLVTPYAGSGQHTLRFTIEQAKVIKLDDKFIPDSIPRNLDIPFLAAPDWAADDGESGFIKNRTHYEQRGENYLEETSVTVDSNLYAELPVPKVDIVPGETYEVILNGEKFVCVAWKAPDQEETVFLGNGESAGYPDQGEDVSFYFDYYAGDSSFYLNAAEGDYTVCINAPRILVKLDEKYIPETIARVSDIPESPVPEVGEAHQMLVTDDSGAIKWDERTHYEDQINVASISQRAMEVEGYNLYKCDLSQDAFNGVLATYMVNVKYNYINYNDLNIQTVSIGDDVQGTSGAIHVIGNAAIVESYIKDVNSDYTHFGPFEHTGEPFAIVLTSRNGVNTNELMANSTMAGDMYCDIIANSTKLLDEKFIPSTIARTSSVEEVATNLETLSNSLVSVATTGDYNDLINTPTDLATTSYVDTKVSELVDSSPETLNTLNELAKALGEDPNFATTVSTQIGEIRNDLNAHTGDVISIDEIDAICNGTIQPASEVMF